MIYGLGSNLGENKNFLLLAIKKKAKTNKYFLFIFLNKKFHLFDD